MHCISDKKNLKDWVWENVFGTVNIYIYMQMITVLKLQIDRSHVLTMVFFLYYFLVLQFKNH